MIDNALTPGQFNNLPPLPKVQGGNPTNQPVAPVTQPITTPASTPTNRTIPIETVTGTAQKPFIPPDTSAQTQTNSGTPIINTAQQTIQQINADQLKADQTQIDQQKQINDPLYIDKTNLANQIAGKGQEQLGMEVVAGIPETQKTLKGLNDQITSAVNSYNQKQLTASQSGVPQPVLIGQLRDEALIIGNLTASAQVLQGNITAAEDTISKTIDAKYSGLTALYNDKIDTLNRNEALMTEAQKNLAADKKSQYAQELQSIKDKAAQEKQDKKDTLSMINNAQANGASSNVLNKALGVLQKGGSAIDVSRALGAYASTPSALKAAQNLSGAGTGVSLATLTPEQNKKLNDLKLTSVQKENALGIVNGQRPPLTGFGMNSKEGQAVTAGALALGYDMVKASNDWTAMQKRIATMNSTSQVRLQQAVTFSYDSLDVIDQLNNAWKGGGFPDFNKVSLLVAEKGINNKSLPTPLNISVKNPDGSSQTVTIKDKQGLAQLFNAQINDLTSELGTVYKGGNSSTDESLKLAAGNLNSSWSESTLNSAINLARLNLQIRKNSITTSTDIPGNMYSSSSQVNPFSQAAGLGDYYNPNTGNWNVPQ